MKTTKVSYSLAWCQTNRGNRSDQLGLIDDQTLVIPPPMSVTVLR